MMRKDLDYKPLLLVPLLALALMAGPVGLLLWLIVRERKAREMHPAQNRIRM